MRIFLKLDSYVTDSLISRYQNDKLRRIASVLTHLGDAVLHIPIFLAFYFCGGAEMKRFVLITFYSTLMGVAVLYVIRLTFKRRRPIGDMPGEFAIVPLIENYSFPSGHALRNFLFSITAYPFFGPYVSACLFFFAAFITMTRVYLKLHYITDILAGGALGMISAYAALKFMNY